MAFKVLVIDDNEGVRESFQLALEDTEYVVITAHTGEEGVEKANNENPSLIFLDLKMPGIGGVETLRRLREIHPDTPIYIVTAFQKEYLQLLQKTAKEGIDYEICAKPIDGDQIRKIVDGVLKK